MEANKKRKHYNNLRPKRKPLEIRDVASAVVQLVQSGIKPSCAKIVDLKGGSLTTVAANLKYMRENYNDLKDIKKLALDFNIPYQSGKAIIDELNDLKRQIKNLTLLNLRLEKDNASFNIDRVKYIAEIKNLKSLNETMLAERKNILGEIKVDKDLEIKSLQEELAETHKIHSEKYREFAFKHDEDLMQLKIENVNLREKIKAYDAKENASQDKTLHLAQQNAKLREENERLVNLLREKGEL